MDKLQTKSEKQYYIPMEVNEASKEIFIANGYDLSTDAVWTKIGHRTVRAIMIPATKEQYLEYMRPLWREDKQAQRASKQEDKRKMLPVSLDQLYEDTEYEMSDGVDLEEDFIKREMLKELHAALDELEGIDRTIMKMFGDDVLYTLSDEFNTVTYSDFVSTAVYLMHFLHGGRTTSRSCS